MIIYDVADISKAAKKRAVKMIEKQYKQKYNWNYSCGRIEDALHIGSDGNCIVTASSIAGSVRVLGRDKEIIKWNENRLPLGEL